MDRLAYGPDLGSPPLSLFINVTYCLIITVYSLTPQYCRFTEIVVLGVSSDILEKTYLGLDDEWWYLEEGEAVNRGAVLGGSTALYVMPSLLQLLCCFVAM